MPPGAIPDVAVKCKKLIKYVRNNDVKSLERLILKDSGLLRIPYGQPFDNKNILHIACNDQNEMQNVSGATIEKLITLGADLREPSYKDHWEPLHYAALNANSEKLGVILKYLKKTEVSSLVYCSNNLKQTYTWLTDNLVKKSYSNNALNVILKYGNRLNQFYECVELLVRAGVDVYQADSNGLSPLDLARKIDDRTLEIILDGCEKNQISFNQCFDAIYRENVHEFRSLNVQDCCDGFDEISSSCTILQLVCAKGLTACAKFLLDNGVSPNKVIVKNPNPPLMIAIKNNSFDIIHLLLKCQDIELPEDILLKLQMKFKKAKNVDKAKKCMALLSDYLLADRPSLKSRLLKATDDLNRTALHYAGLYGGSNQVLNLLSMGASLTIKDIFGVTPLDNIEQDILKKFLDTCINVPNDDDDMNNLLYSLQNKKHQFVIEIDYKSLISIDNKKETLESDFLYHILKKKAHKDLLNHPVILYYLALKWEKFKWLHYSNLLLFVIAYISLIFYGFAYIELSDVSNGLILMSLMILSSREISQIALLNWEYFRKVESYLNLILIAGIIYILASSSFGVISDVTVKDDKNLLVAFAIVFLSSTLGIFIQLGNFPLFTVKVIILRRITVNFFTHMIFYIFPVLAFAFCFYMLAEDKSDLFFMTIYNTFTMFAGDPDSAYPDQFKTNPIFSHIIYVIFVVFIVIILQNLLIALAVSDIQEIFSEAEYIKKKERVVYITSLERVVHRNYTEAKSRATRKLYKTGLSKLNIFKESTILVIQPYNKGVVYLKDDVDSKTYINDQSAIQAIQSVIETIVLEDEEEVEAYSMKSMHQRLEKIEVLLNELLLANRPSIGEVGEL